jgi:hypothetical protein
VVRSQTSHKLLDRSVDLRRGFQHREVSDPREDTWLGCRDQFTYQVEPRVISPSFSVKLPYPPETPPASGHSSGVTDSILNPRFAGDSLSRGPFSFIKTQTS